MASVVTRKIPEIVLVDKEQLGVKELFTLNMLHKTDVSEFVICPHQRETIYLNKSFERAEDLIPIINGFMEQEWCNSKGDKLYKQFEDIAGEKAVSILSAIWQDWRKERMKANAKEKADEVLKRVRKRHIRQSMKKRKGTIQAVFEVGYGLYDKKRLADFQNGHLRMVIYALWKIRRSNRVLQNKKKALISAPPLIRASNPSTCFRIENIIA